MPLPVSRGRRGLVALWLAFGCSSGGSKDVDTPTNQGGSVSGGAASSSGMARGGTGAGGTLSSRGGTANGGNRAEAGAPGARGGATGFGGASAGVPGLPSYAGFPATLPPPPQSNGNSPYLRPCYGDTASCVDVANLRCLGIRDGSDVRGYSCSNPCNDASDCSTAPTLVTARAECVDFTTQKHCLLVCLENGDQRDCPSGMTCYNYPGNPLGYCLWK